MRSVFRVLVLLDLVAAGIIIAINLVDPDVTGELIRAVGIAPFVAVAGILFAVFFGAPAFGLYQFRWWGRLMFTLVAALFVIGSALTGGGEMSGALLLLITLENMLLGAILALAYCPPLSERFRCAAAAD